jgi:hypothetical protein
MSYQVVIDENIDTQYRGEATYFSYNIHVDLPDQFLAGYIATHIVDAHIQELANAGSDLLHLKLLEDKLSGTWSTDFKVEVWASGNAPDADTGLTSFGEGISRRVGGVWLAAVPLIIEAVIALIIVVGVIWSLTKVQHLAEYLGPTGGTIAIVAGAVAVAAVAFIILKR